MFNNVAFAQAVGVAADFNGTPFNCKGGRVVLGGFGAFGGGTLKVQYTTDNDTTWVDLGTQTGSGVTSLTAAGSAMFYLPPGRFRVIFTGSTAPTLSWWIGEAND